MHKIIPIVKQSPKSWQRLYDFNSPTYTLLHINLYGKIMYHNHRFQIML